MKAAQEAARVAREEGDAGAAAHGAAEAERPKGRISLAEYRRRRAAA